MAGKKHSLSALTLSLIISLFLTFACLPMVHANGNMTTLVMQGGAFEATLSYANFPDNDFSLLPDSASGQANAVQLTDDTGYFWFPNTRNQKNVEILVKILNGCAINNRVWVFAAGTTNLGLELTIRNTTSGEVRTYSNTAGHLFSPVLDTNAFQEPFCPAKPLENTIEETPPNTLIQRIVPSSEKQIASQAFHITPKAGTCTGSPVHLCLIQNRFQVQVDWQTAGTSGQGQVYPLAGTEESGLFWFFNASNVEIIVKVIDGRMTNGYFWVFIGALTNVGFTVTVTDTETGAVRAYTNPLSSTPVPVGDNTAFSELSAVISASLDDISGDGRANQEESIEYRVQVSNPTSLTKTNVLFSDVPDSNTFLLNGTVTTSRGTVTIGNTPGDTTIGVNIGDLLQGDSAEITWVVKAGFIRPPFTDIQIVNQGYLSGSDFSGLSTGQAITPAYGISGIPTLNEWGCIVLAGILGVLAMFRLKRYGKTT